MISGAPLKIIAASFFSDRLKNMTEPRPKTTRVYTTASARFFLLRRHSEDRVKSRIFRCFSMALIMALLQYCGGTEGRPAGEMLQGQGMALEGSMPIGLGEVAGIAGLGGEAQVREPQVLSHLGHLSEHRQVGLPGEVRLEEDRRQEENAAPDKKQKAVGFS